MDVRISEAAVAQQTLVIMGWRFSGLENVEATKLSLQNFKRFCRFLW